MVEITRGSRGTGWHVHLHVLVHGLFIDQRALSDHWHRSTRTSYIVDVRSVPNTDAGLRYCCKYISKPLDASIVNDHAALCEAVCSLKGARLWGAFGSWWRRAKAAKPIDQVKWKTVARLDTIVQSAAAGEPFAIGLMLMLKRKVVSAGTNVRVVKLSGIPPDEVATSKPATEVARRG